MRKKILLFLIISIFGFVAGFILSNSVDFNLCLQGKYNCRELFNNIGDPLFFGSFALSVIFLILLILPQAFRAWKKFAVWFIPLATLLFIFYPDPGSGDYFSPYPEQVFQWVSMMYIGASLGIIAVALVNDWRKRKGNAPLHTLWYWVGAVPLAYIAIKFTTPLLAFFPF